jgi:hypothetical protein
VRATDASGNTDATAASYSWTVVAPPDTTAPETTIDSGPEASTTSTDATLNFSADEAGSTFECSLDGAVYGACTSPASYTGLGLGGHTFSVRATDASGNTDTTPATYEWTVVDGAAPDTNIGLTPELSTSDTSAAFTFSADEAGSTFECSLDGAAYAACVSPASYTGLALGGHTFSVRATDASGNTDATAASYSWTVVAPPDTTAPETTINSGPEATTADTGAAFTFSANEAGTFECSLDGAPFVACVSPASYTGLGLGGHTFSVAAIDGSGNTDPTPASNGWTVVPPPDTTAPDTTVDSGPEASTTSTDAEFTFSSNEAVSTFECSLDGAAYAACTSPLDLTGLAVGGHTFSVRAIDASGNTDATAASHSWTVVAPPDTTAPETTIDSGPATTTSETSAAFTFSADEVGSTFECALDGAAYAACTSPVDLTDLAVGDHTFSVRATDSAGNTDATAASYSWTVEAPAPPDTTAPNTTVEIGPASGTKQTTAVFAFSADEAGATFECSLDGGAYAACASPVGYTGLVVGSHTFSVRATDAVGNTDTTPASHAWTIASSVVSCGSQVTVGASADAWVDQSSRDQNKGTDSTLKVRTKNGAANVRALLQFNLPAAPAGCAVGTATLRVYSDSAVNGRTLQVLQVIGPWTENGVTWTNQPGTTGTAATAASGTGWKQWTVTGMVNAMYGGTNNGFLLKDATENHNGGFEQAFHSREKGVDTPQLVITFVPVADTTAPDTTIGSGPAATTTDTSATITFSASEADVVYQCRLDGGAWTWCVSPRSYTGLAVGSHTFEVRALDPAGNADPTPAIHTWSIQP